MSNVQVDNCPYQHRSVRSPLAIHSLQFGGAICIIATCNIITVWSVIGAQLPDVIHHYELPYTKPPCFNVMTVKQVMVNYNLCVSQWRQHNSTNWGYLQNCTNNGTLKTPWLLRIGSFGSCDICLQLYTISGVCWWCLVTCKSALFSACICVVVRMINPHPIQIPKPVFISLI